MFTHVCIEKHCDVAYQFASWMLCHLVVHASSAATHCMVGILFDVMCYSACDFMRISLPCLGVSLVDKRTHTHRIWVYFVFMHFDHFTSQFSLSPTCCRQHVNSHTLLPSLLSYCLNNTGGIR